MLDRLEIRISTEELNKIAMTLLFGSVFGAMLLPFTGIRYSSAEYLWIVVFLALLDTVIYFVARNHVLVTLTEEGIVGRGGTGRQIVFGWSDPIVISEKRLAGRPSIEIAVEGDGILRKQASAVMIPKSVLGRTEFRAFVERYAPQNHPLRSFDR